MKAPGDKTRQQFDHVFYIIFCSHFLPYDCSEGPWNSPSAFWIYYQGHARYWQWMQEGGKGHKDPRSGGTSLGSRDAPGNKGGTISFCYTYVSLLLQTFGAKAVNSPVTIVYEVRGSDNVSSSKATLEKVGTCVLCGTWGKQCYHRTLYNSTHPQSLKIEF